MGEKKRKKSGYADIWLVSDKLILATEDDVAAMEKSVGFRAPSGYRQYVSTLGQGEFCNILGVRMPDSIVKQPKIEPDVLEGLEEALEDADLDLTMQDIMDSIWIAGTSNGDQFVVHPDQPDRIIAFPRDCDEVSIVKANSIDLSELYWAASRRREAPSFRSFEPFGIGGDSFEMYPAKPNVGMEEMVQWYLGQFTNGPQHREDVALSSGTHIVWLYLKAVGGYAYIEANEKKRVDRVLFKHDAEHSTEAKIVKLYLKQHGFGK